MAIFRGAGGPGDATTDAANEASVASTKAAEAQASANAAASSATSAASSATTSTTKASEASTSATNAAASATTATTKASEASTSATNAATSETNAATSETNAATSATSAASSATTATTQATAAASSATSAASSATTATTKASEASTSATSAASSYDSFDDRYLGAKSSAPSVDNDGDALLTGALYWNTSSNQLFVWDGATWNQAAFSISGSVTSFNTRTGAVTLSASDVNTALGSDAVLDSDIGSTVQAFATVLSNTTASYTTAEETKLAGIETAADVTDTLNVTAAGALMDSEVTNLAQVKAFSSADYATAAQGALADTALQSFTETNDLTAAVTWANVPNANITQSSVTQHQAALSVTESQISDLGTYVTKTSATGSAEIPSGTTAQRDVSPSAGYLRFNSTDTSFEGYDGSAWGAIGGGGGATGGGSDQVFYENGQTVTTNYTLTSNTNAMSTGPITINSGVAVTVPTGGRLVII